VGPPDAGSKREIPLVIEVDQAGEVEKCRAVNSEIEEIATKFMT
jgi:hypothetical protein